MHAFLTAGHTKDLEDIQEGTSDKIYLKIVDNDTKNDKGEGTMIAWADWIVLADESKPKSSGALSGIPPAEINHEFCYQGCRKTEHLRNRVLRNKKCYGKRKVWEDKEPS